MMGAALDGANLAGTDFTQATLGGATLRGIRGLAPARTYLLDAMTAPVPDGDASHQESCGPSARP
jgi:hypothetical protein